MLSAVMRFIGRLSVGRKLILIYALDLSAVIFVSGILISEKFIAIDFARKEVVGNQYIAVVRDALIGLHGARPAGEKLRAAEAAYGRGMDSRELADKFAAQLAVPGGANEHWNPESGETWLRRLRETWPDHAWLNPVPAHDWQYTRSIQMIGQIFDGRMQPLTLDGLTQAMRLLG